MSIEEKLQATIGGLVFQIQVQAQQIEDLQKQLDGKKEESRDTSSNRRKTPAS